MRDFKEDDMRQIPRAVADISYAYSVKSKSGQTDVKLLENATGPLTLIKRAQAYQDEVARGRVSGKSLSSGMACH